MQKITTFQCITSFKTLSNLPECPQIISYDAPQHTQWTQTKKVEYDPPYLLLDMFPFMENVHIFGYFVTKCVILWWGLD